MKIKSNLMLCSAALALLATAATAQITDEMLANPPAGEWINYGHNLENYRHSPLTQVSPENVKNLQLVWSRGMEPGQIQVTPMVHNGVMYLANPGDVIQAIDAKNGDLIWEHRRALPNVSLLSSLGNRKRGVTLYQDKVYFVSWDNHLIALNMADGQVAFDIDRGQGDEGITNTSAPIVANGTIIAGSTCQYSEFGCYISGHDSTTGEELWRNYFIPKPGEEGDETWGNDYESRWMTGAWGQIVYDPVLDLVYFGSTGSGPASETQRGTPGGSMYGTNTRFAVRPATGEIVWRHQTLPRDNWDQECTFEMMPINIDVAPADDMDGKLAIGPNATGEDRRVLTGIPCKTGIMWQFDAASGEFLWARETTAQNLVESIDETGLVTMNEAVILKEIEQDYDMCPTFLGGRDVPSAAVNPNTGVYFIPLQNSCAVVSATDQEFTGADSYNITHKVILAPGKENMGRIDAIDIKTGKTLWTHERPASNYSSVMSTETGLLFNGGMDRYFRALSQETGEVLWETRLASIASGSPITYEIDGVQYIAMGAGGTSYGTAFNGALDKPTDSVAIGGAIYVFALPQD